MGAAAAVAVAGVVVAIAAVVYVADRSELRGQVDDSLSEVAAPLVAQSYTPPGGPNHYGGGGYGSYGAPPARFGGASGYVQFVHSDGTVERPQSENSPLPVSQHTLVVASGSSKRFFSDTIVDHVHLRVLTVAVSGGALQVARPLSEVDHVLKRLRVVLLVVGADRDRRGRHDRAARGAHRAGPRGTLHAPHGGAHRRPGPLPPARR